MIKTYITSAIAGALLLGLGTVAIAATTGEYSNYCAMGLAKGQKISTDCTIHGQVEGKTYCFGNQAAMDEFMKDPKGNLTKAEAYYSKP
jgi:YHS domain-containing protein